MTQKQRNESFDKQQLYLITKIILDLMEEKRSKLERGGAFSPSLILEASRSE